MEKEKFNFFKIIQESLEKEGKVTEPQFLFEAEFTTEKGIRKTLRFKYPQN